MKKAIAFALASCLVLFVPSPAIAESENRIRTEAMEIFVPKSFKAPKSGCSIIPIKYKWRYFLNHETILADITLYAKGGWIVGQVFLEPDSTGGKGVAELKICSTRWVGEEELIEGKLVPGTAFQQARKGSYKLELGVVDFENEKNMFQYRSRPIRLR
jgi:hypothetical protein